MGHAEIHRPAPDIAAGFDQRIAVHPAEHGLLGFGPAAARFCGKQAESFAKALHRDQHIVLLQPFQQKAPPFAPLPRGSRGADDSHGTPPRQHRERLASEALIVATSQHGSSGFHDLSQGPAPFSQPYPWGIIMAPQ